MLAMLPPSSGRIKEEMEYNGPENAFDKGVISNNATYVREELSKNKINLLSPNSIGFLLIHLAYMMGAPDVLTILIEAEPTSMSCIVPKSKITALHLAAEQGCRNCVIVLLNAGCLDTVVDCNGCLAFGLAGYAGNFEIMQFLYMAYKGTDKEVLAYMDKKDNMGATGLYGFLQSTTIY